MLAWSKLNHSVPENTKEQKKKRFKKMLDGIITRYKLIYFFLKKEREFKEKMYPLFFAQKIVMSASFIQASLGTPLENKRGSWSDRYMNNGSKKIRSCRGQPSDVGRISSFSVSGLIPETTSGFWGHTVSSRPLFVCWNLQYN